MIDRRTLLGGVPLAALASATPTLGQAWRAGDEMFRILIGGDVSFAESYHVQYPAEGQPDIIATKGYDYTIGGLAPLLLRADYTIVNLETPITDLPRSPLADTGKDYLHWTHIDRAPDRLAAYGVDAVSLANNHTLDFGRPGLEQTFDALRRHGISWFGAGNDEGEAAEPLVRNFRLPGGDEFRIALFGQFEVRKAYDERYDFYAGPEKSGAARLSLDRFATQVADLKQRFPRTLAIAFPHWGSNYEWRSDEQARLGRGLIDAGADMVIGHHGHTLQEIEFYKGRWIFYGIGNFLFNSRGRFAQYPNILPWSLAVELNVGPKREAAQMEIALYPILSDNLKTNYRPQLATAREARSVFATLSTRSQLGPHRFRAAEDAVGAFATLPMPVTS